MKDKFQELYETTKIDRDKSNWSKKITMKGRLEELKSEVLEAIEAYESGDMEHFKDELGDIFWDATFLITLAEEKGLFEGKDVMENMIAKYKRRKPWVFENKDVSPEEEDRLWALAKEKEKEMKNKQ